MHFRTSITLAACAAALICAAPAQAQTVTEAWRLGGLKFPESVIFDAANKRFIVSNMVTFGPDGGTDGYLSIVSPDGTMVTEQWVSGLSDPKGMAIVGDSLFVADSNGLVEIGLGDGAIANVYPVPDAKLLNDVATDGADVFVSDLLAQTIFRLSNGSVETWLAAGAVTLPNGLFVKNGTLVVGNLGAGLKPDFSVETKGGLQAVDIGTKAVTPFFGAAEVGSIDGVAQLGDWLIFDDNPTGTIYAYAGDAVTSIATLAPGAADLWAEGNMLYVPMTQTGELIALRVE